MVAKSLFGSNVIAQQKSIMGSQESDDFSIPFGPLSTKICIETMLKDVFFLNIIVRQSLNNKHD